MKKLGIIAASTFLAGSLFISSAAIAGGVLATGPYVSAAILGMQRGDTPADEFLTNANVFIIHDLTGRVSAGYRFNDNVSVEAGYNFLADDSGTDHYNGESYPYSIELNGVDAAVVLNTLVTNKISLFAKGGAAIIRTKLYNRHFFSPVTDIKQTNVLPEIGGGVNYYFTKRFAMGVTTTYMFSRNATPYILTYGLRASYTF